MRGRITKLMVGIAAIAALAVGGSSLAAAGSKSSPPAAPAASTQPADTDTVQQGDQSAPDTTAGKAAEANDPADPADSAAEAANTESATANDGPGGHADEPGNANADHQATGAE